MGGGTFHDDSLGCLKAFSPYTRINTLSTLNSIFIDSFSCTSYENILYLY